MPRYSEPPPNATFLPSASEPNDRAELIFDEPQRALTPGQICALYDGERLIGGAVFESIQYDN